jgi:hypothetical protein
VLAQSPAEPAAGADLRPWATVHRTSDEFDKGGTPNPSEESDKIASISASQRGRFARTGWQVVMQHDDVVRTHPLEDALGQA